MAVHHSLEVADGSLDDDGRLRRTGQALFELFMCYACIVPSCAFEFGAHLGVWVLRTNLKLLQLLRNLMKLHCSYHHRGHWIRSPVSGLEYGAAGVDSWAGVLDWLRDNHLRFCCPSVRLLPVSRPHKRSTELFLHGCGWSKSW